MNYTGKLYVTDFQCFGKESNLHYEIWKSSFPEVKHLYSCVFKDKPANLLETGAYATLSLYNEKDFNDFKDWSKKYFSHFPKKSRVPTPRPDITYHYVETDHDLTELWKWVFEQNFNGHVAFIIVAMNYADEPTNKNYILFEKNNDKVAYDLRW